MININHPSPLLSPLYLFASTLLLSPHSALDNGVARTPPMGWMSWERFECNTDCDTDPLNCISERLLMSTADRMASDGYRDVGYQYISIDDCWLASKRDSMGRLQPDPKRFPSGMKALADYLHSLDIKLGIYEDIGNYTCAGFPGSAGHFEIDAQTFAAWGVDMLKFDGCSAVLADYDIGYPAMGKALNATGRHIVYSCEWPMYQRYRGGKVNYTAVANTCNMFRDWTDIYDSWDSVYGMIGAMGDDSENASQVAAPGAWNDPDQLVIGNFGLSHDQERAQMATWAILTAPLIVSADLRAIRPSSKAILQNKGVIAISQDPRGVQGRRVKWLADGLSVWTKPLAKRESYAVSFLYAGNQGGPVKAKATLASIGLTHAGGYNVTEVFEGQALGYFKPNDVFTCYVNPTGVYLVTFMAL